MSAHSLALMLFRTELSVIGIIGILLLIGIVKKNAILMVDFALEAERAEGMRPREAIYQACLLRFRPILMTTMAALFGALPLVISSGMGPSCAGHSASQSSAGSSLVRRSHSTPRRSFTSTSIAFANGGQAGNSRPLFRRTQLLVFPTPFDKGVTQASARTFDAGHYLVRQAIPKGG